MFLDCIDSRVMHVHLCTHLAQLLLDQRICCPLVFEHESQQQELLLPIRELRVANIRAYSSRIYLAAVLLACLEERLAVLSVAELEPVLGCQLDCMLVAVNLEDWAACVIIDFLGPLVSVLCCFLRKWRDVKYPYLTGSWLFDGLVRVYDGVVGIDMVHSTRIVWHCVLVDVKRCWPRLDVEEGMHLLLQLIGGVFSLHISVSQWRQTRCAFLPTRD